MGAASLLVQFWPYLLAAGAALTALWKAYAMGKAKNQARHDAADAAARSEAQTIDDTVAGRAPDDNRGRLAKWSRS